MRAKDQNSRFMKDFGGQGPHHEEENKLISGNVFKYTDRC